MRLGWGILISAVFHAALLCVPVQQSSSRILPSEELRFFIVHELPILREAPPASPPLAVRPLELPLTASKPESAPRKPAAAQKKPNRASSRWKESTTPERAAVKQVPVPIETAAEAPISPPPAAAENIAAEPAATQSQGGNMSTGTALASIPVELGSGSGPVAFGSVDGPKFLRRSLPRYPRRARDMGREGTVVLRVAIDEKGNLTDVDVVQPAGYGFDEEAVRAIRDSTFKPAVRDGVPAACLAELPVRFVLRSAQND